MHGFLYKEFALGKARIISLTVIDLIMCGCALVFSSFDEDAEFKMLLCGMVFFAGYLGVSMLNSEVFKLDERHSWCAFAMSSPASVKGYIQAKYLFFIIMNLMVLFMELITGIIMAVIANDLGFMFGGLNLLLFCGQLFITAIEIPFLIRFGADKGATVKMNIFGWIAVLVMIYFLYGDISFIIESDSLIEALTSQTSFVWGIAVFPYISCVMYYLSYLISVRLYRKGSAAYEQ